ncbi:hypothetical protein FHX74_002093 [Friedmanniella endophytica]|uniref:Glyoxalase-like domain-containing protein n=1 Tax=Microlunatus kandeliicorticis TaxID=1759536 RepID=A0A7W3P602_9ACTN|nr:VOC family protein [Microlunatus kandeliicorticis]MBA8794474.1 hypothetical protein [Microlunatus kandeliicorticis]
MSGTTRFKDLVIDAVDAGAAATFWSRVLGLTAEERPNGFVLIGEQPTDTVWINAVPEPHTVKNRVHLDVHVGSIRELTALGARVSDDRHRWTIMTDPDGQEFCAFVRDHDELPQLRMYELVVDCADPAAQARWWGDRFGVTAETDAGGWWWLDGDAVPWPLVFNPVPEPKTIKNRVHWDVIGDVDALVAAGATVLRPEGDDLRWSVLADPEGNEFCVFTDG